jgi:hypothetical protein
MRIVLPLFALFTTACLEYDLKLEIEEKGGCRLRQELILLEPVYQQAEREAGEIKGPLFHDEATTRERIAAKGGQMELFEKSSQQGRLRLLVQARFPSAEGLEGESLLGQSKVLKGATTIWEWDPGPLISSLAKLDEPTLEQQLSQLQEITGQLRFRLLVLGGAPQEGQFSPMENGMGLRFDPAAFAKLQGKARINAFRQLVLPRRVVLSKR